MNELHTSEEQYEQTNNSRFPYRFLRQFHENNYVLVSGAISLEILKKI